MPTRTTFTSPRLRRTVRHAIPWGILAALCLACTVEEGERASGGACPEGETCSETTTGLTFYGPPPTDDASAELLPRVAAGGSLNLRFGPSDGSSLGEVEVTSTAPWFLTVEGADAERDQYALWSEQGDLHLEGQAAGTAYVRVAEAETDALVDRVAIEVERIARVDALVLGTAPGAAPVVRPGQTASVVFQLHGDSQLRLVDESLTVGAEDTTVTRVSWDCVDVIVPDAQELIFEVDAGHRRWEVRIPITR